MRHPGVKVEVTFGNSQQSFERLLAHEADWLSLFSQYETRLDRMLHRALHELQRLQARRAGDHMPPPLVVDVDLRGLGSVEDPPAPISAPLPRG